MKGLKEFLLKLKEDEGLKAEAEKLQGDASKLVEFAKKHGYEFTESEYEALMLGAVAGGNFGRDAKDVAKAGLKDGLNAYVNSGGDWQTTATVTGISLLSALIDKL